MTKAMNVLMQPRLASIVARASAPWERAAFTGFVPRPDQDALIDRRIKQWVDDVAAGDPRVLADVLHLRGQDNEGLRRSLADADVRAEQAAGMGRRTRAVAR